MTPFNHWRIDFLSIEGVGYNLEIHEVDP